MAKDKSKYVFDEMPVASALRTMVVPSIISQIIVLVYNMADTFFVGQTNNPYMVAGTSLILPIFNITLCLAGLGGIGGGSLVSRLLGREDYEEARRASAFSLNFSIVVALTFSLLTAVFMEPLLRMLGASTDTMGYAKQYITCVIVCGALPTVLSNALSNLFRSVGESKKAGFGITFGGLLNIVLDPFFMFFIFPDGYEVLGAGIATCLSNCIASLYFLTQMFRLRRNNVLTFRAPFPKAESIRAVFGVGIPGAVSTFLFDVDYIIIDRLMASYNDFALAAIGIVLKIERFPLNVGIGICQGMMPLVAFNYASSNQVRMDACIRLARNLGLFIAGISILIYEIFAPKLTGLFLENPATYDMSTTFLRIRILATPLMFVSFFTVHLFQAFGKGGISLFLGLMRWLTFNIPMLFILNHIFGMYGIVWSQIAADTLTATLSMFVFLRKRPRFAQTV